MPKADYEFLSDRQREYLQNPDDFDSQRSAELAYRIRQKYAATLEDFELLYETPALWDKTEHEISAVLTCHYEWPKAGPSDFGGCENEENLDPFWVKGELSEADQRMAPPGWTVADMNPPAPFPSPIDPKGICPDCREKAREYARTHGTVPCQGGKHSAHRVGSDQFKSCYDRLALTGQEMREIDAIETPLREKN